MSIRFTQGGILGTPATSKSQFFAIGANSTLRQSTDWRYLSSVKIANALENSSYSIDYTGGANVTTGTIDSTGQVIEQVYCIDDPDGFTVRVRKYGKTEIEIPIGVLRTQFFFYCSQDNDSYIDSSDPSAYTGITIDHDNEQIMIDEAHTYQELYDYCAYNLSLEANIDKSAIFYTTDGVTYYCTYDLIIDGVLFTATNKIIDCGSKDFSLENGGTVDAARITDVDGTLVSVTLNDVVVGSVYEVYKTSNGDSLGSGTAADTTVAINYQHTADVSVACRVRKAGRLEYYSTGTVTTSGLTFNVAQSADLNYNADYDTDTSTYWTLNTTAFSLEHTSGTEIITTRDLYSWTMDYMANTARMQKELPMSAQTPNAFTLINSYTMTDGSHEYLKNGALTEEDGDILWASVYTIGTIATGNIYIVQDGTKMTAWWGNGNIDILVKVKSGGTLIDSGNITLFTREFNYLYDHYEVDLSGGGRTAVSISNSADSNNETAGGTVAGYSDITITQSAQEDKQIDEDDTAGDYTWGIDANGRTVQEVYEYLKYLVREGSTTDLGVDGEQWTTLNASFGEIKDAPFGTLAGGVFFGARGLWLEGVNSADALNYVLTDNDDAQHQAAIPPVAINVTSIVSGSTLYIYDVSNATELVDQVVNDTSYEYEYAEGSGQNIIIKLRKAGYKTYETSGTTNASGLSVTATQESDDAYNASYNAGMATDWSINTTTKKLTRNTTNWNTIRDFHSYWNYLFATTDYMEFDVPTFAFTKYEIQLENEYTFDSATDFQKLKTGSIADPDADDLCGSIITLGSASTETIYLVQNDTKVASAWWSAGNIDILIKVKESGTLIDSGLVHIYCRDFNSIFDHTTLTITEGGKNYASLNVGADSNNVTDAEDVADYDDIIIDEAGSTVDITAVAIDEDDTPADYDIGIDCEGHTIQEVFEYLKYVTRSGSTYTLQSDNGEEYIGESPSYTESKNGPFGSFVGGTFYGARGVWLIDVASADALNYVLTDSTGSTHQATAPLPNLSVTNIVDGSRIQVYDVTADTELANEVVSGTTYQLEYTYWGTDHTLRVRLMYVSGTSAYEWYESNVVASSTGASMIASQTANSVYNTNNIDGSTVTECSISGATIRIYVDDPDNTTTAQRIYNWFQYYLSTEDGIAEQSGDYISATDTTHYTFDNSMKIINQDTSNPLNITGANIVPTSGAATNIFDLTNGASIALNFNRVEGFAYSSGSGLSTEEHNALLAVEAKTAILPDDDLLTEDNFLALK